MFFGDSEDSEDFAMTTDAKSKGSVSVTLNDEETAELLQLVEHSLGETRVEVHRTHTPDFRDKVQHREAVLRGLVEKLKSARS